MYTSSLLLTQLTQAFKGMLGLHQDFSAWLEEAGMALSDAQFEKLAHYLQLLKEKNELMNLTRITEPREMWIKHIFDGLMAAPFVARVPGAKVIDLGCGGGIPGIPLAILFPSARFTLVDSVQKKAAAVGEFAQALGLKNVFVLSGRIETLGQQRTHREQYDVALARALAPLRVLAELAIPLIHPYGQVVAYKGAEYLQELSEAQAAFVALKSEKPRVYRYSLPEGQGERALLSISKKWPTPSQYPRREGIPGKKPL